MKMVLKAKGKPELSFKMIDLQEMELSSSKMTLIDRMRGSYIILVVI